MTGRGLRGTESGDTGKLTEREKGAVGVKRIKRGRKWKGETQGWGSGNGRSVG